jgi:hypothetical protein
VTGSAKRGKSRGLSEEELARQLRRAAAISLKEIADLHHEMRGKPVQHNRVLPLLSKMFSLRRPTPGKTRGAGAQRRATMRAGASGHLGV